jgi:aryl-alcohol dehydrogenase-like predicted oxidoreductase
MQRRMLGRTGIEVSRLGFGCGAVGGLMVRGTAADQERAVARALELGIDYFDTAPLYGDGASETNLGRVLKTLAPDIFLSTKFTILPADQGRIAEAVTASIDASLRRLGRERVDLLQLHNRIASDGVDRPLAPEILLDQVVPALEGLRRQGKIRFAGITALGDTTALHRIVEAKAFDTAQICYNLLNPTAGMAAAPGTGGQAGFPGQDFAGLLSRAHEVGMGTIGIRVLAGGALSGSTSRHPLGMASPAPIASGPDYETDVERARRLDALVRAGHAGTLVEAGLRFVISNDALSTVLIGLSTQDQLEAAAAAVEKGPLPREALDLLPALWRS